MEYKFGSFVKGIIENSSIDAIEKKNRIENGRITFNEIKDICAKSTLLDESETRPKPGELLMKCLADMVPVFEVYEKNVTHTKTKEYVELMDRLRSEQEEREYRQMIHKDAGSYTSEVDEIGKYAFMRDKEVDVNKLDFGKEAKAVKHQMTTIFNIFITVVSVGYAVWYWTGSSSYILTEWRVLLSLSASILVLVAEVVVFGGYIRKVDDARDRARKEVETKQVMETVVIGGGRGNRKANLPSQEHIPTTASANTTSIQSNKTNKTNKTNRRRKA